MTNDTDQLKMRILYLEKELDRWKSDYILYKKFLQEYIEELEEKLKLNPFTRTSFAIKDPRQIKDGKYID